MNEFTISMCYVYKGVPNRFVTLRKKKNGTISAFNEFGKFMSNFISGEDMAYFLIDLFGGMFAS